MASPSEHLDFLRLLSRQMEVRKRQEEAGDQQEQQEEVKQEEEMVSADAANFAEAQVRFVTVGN